MFSKIFNYLNEASYVESKPVGSKPVESKKNLNVSKKRKITAKEVLDDLLGDSTPDIKKPFMHKSDRKKAMSLEKAGFADHPMVHKLHEFQILNESYNKQMRDSLVSAPAFQEFAIRYPNNKIISLEHAERVRDKYKFHIGFVDNFIGYIPDKNLDDILNFKMQNKYEPSFDQDVFFTNEYQRFSNRIRNNFRRDKVGVRYHPQIARQLESERWSRMDTGYNDVSFNIPLMILAPSQMFSETKVPPVRSDDPIVLKVVKYKHELYAMVITAWGDEAKDVVNERFN